MDHWFLDFVYYFTVLVVVDLEYCYYRHFISEAVAFYDSWAFCLFIAVLTGMMVHNTELWVLKGFI